MRTFSKPILPILAAAACLSCEDGNGYREPEFLSERTLSVTYRPASVYKTTPLHCLPLQTKRAAHPDFPGRPL